MKILMKIRELEDAYISKLRLHTESLPLWPKNKYRINDMFCTQKRPPFAGNDVLNDAHQSLLSLSGMFYHQMCTLGCQKNDINIELRHRLSIIYIF